MESKTAAMGTSESFMYHPANDRCWPIREAWEMDFSVSFGEKGSISASGLSDCMRLVGLSKYISIKHNQMYYQETDKNLCIPQMKILRSL